MKKTKPKISLTMSPPSSPDSFSKYTYSKTKLKPRPKLTLTTNIQTLSNQETVKKMNIVQKDINYHIETLKMIMNFRSMITAPVDTMGCDQLYDNNINELSQKFQILVSIMLSIQTNDKVTSEVVKAMVKEGVLEPRIMSKMKQQEVEPMIRRVNYHKNKAKNIIKAAQSFNQMGAPKTYEDVLKFPGVGVKVATLYMKVAQRENVGIGTDTHVHRIVNRLEWVSTKNLVDTEHKLREYFPKQYWEVMNHALVGFGQLNCEARKPKCHQCPVSNRCPASLI